jgi:hypothetical protein
LSSLLFSLYCTAPCTTVLQLLYSILATSGLRTVRCLETGHRTEGGHDRELERLEREQEKYGQIEEWLDSNKERLESEQERLDSE